MSLPYDGFDEGAFDNMVRETMDEFPTPGVAILVVNGADTWTKCYGSSDLVTNVPVTPHTLFCADSLTKSFTASVAGHVVESPDYPSVRWDTPLVDLIPEDFVLASGTPLGDHATKQVTIEDALSHRTGVPRHDKARTNGDPSVREVVRSLRHLSVKHEPRTKWGYTNIMYTAVVHAVKVVTKRPFADLLQCEILRPLMMDETTCSVAEASELLEEREQLQLARGYLWNSHTSEFEPVPWDQIPPNHGQGGIVSNAVDLGRWIKHLMDPTGLTTALSEKVVKSMLAPRITRDSNPKPPFMGTHAYGMGLDLAVYHGRKIAWHGGAGHGYMSLMLMALPTANPDGNTKGQGWAVLVLQNSRSKARGIIAWHLMDNYLRLPKDQHRTMTEAARKVQAAARSKFENESQELFKDMATDDASRPRLPLAAYEGLYRHVAYHDLRISLGPPSWRTATVEEKGSDADEHRLYLYSGSPKSYHGVSAVLCHVSGEWWRSHQSVNTPNWETDSVRKVEFDVGSDGSVRGIRLQIDRELANNLAYFERVS